MRKDSNGPRLHLPSIPSAAIQQAAVNACVQQQNNLGQEESNAPSKFPNAESDRRQGGTDASAKMSRSQTRACARAGEPITKLSGPPPSLFQPLDSDSSPEEGKSSQRRKTSHFTWAFADHVDFGKPGPGNKYQKPNSAQDPVLVGDDLTVEKTNEEVNSQSQDVDRPVTEVPCVIDLTNGDEDELPAENEKDNWIDEIDGQNHSEDLGDGQRLAQDYQSFLTPRQNKLAPTNNPIQQIPPVQPVSQYHPQIPVNAQSLAPQNGIPHQSQLQEGSVVDAPSGHTYPPNTNHPNSGRQFSHINGNFSSSPSNYSSPYGQDIQQTPEVEPFQSSYPELKNNLPFFNPNDEFLQFLAFEEDYGLQHLPMDQAASLPHHDQAASFPHHGHLNQTNEKHDDGFSDGESDSEEGSSAGRTGNIQKNGRNAKTSPRKYKPRPRETRAEYGYHRPWMSYEEYKYLFPLAEPRLCFENAIAQQMEEDKALIAKGEAIPPRIPITRHIKISHERLDALNQLRLSKGDEPFKPKLSGVKDPFAFLDAKRRRIEEEQEGLPGHENQEMRPNAKRPRLAPAPIQTAAPMNGNPMMVQQDPYAMEKRQRHYLAYRVPKLREKCKALKLSTLGLKGVLIQRLVDHEANSRPAVTNNIQQSNRGQSGWVVRHDQPMPDVGPINGMHARPVGYQGNTRVRPQYSAQRFAGGYMPSLPEGSMHNPPQGIYGTSMRQRPSDNGNGHVNRAMGMTSNHMSRDMNWNDSTQPF
ncbi:predicted protein [Sclerotinia sclerotiorum 1980 UF-70]|uniref:SAP domain-containing protein n=1 Tax=Sclerotinia sclerotiorum (strain ATCC 18683 / 1980 / Ss-1) TaxID=665079 RepID=A7EUI5_SCLS1|nr:predicted protein [Sclerotinia sclerotiorum 1980 UF-70]EDN93127.1 predicted protein [Sclerotinia sclerotiorum 1980 UF-70]